MSPRIIALIRRFYGPIARFKIHAQSVIHKPDLSESAFIDFFAKKNLIRGLKEDSDITSCKSSKYIYDLTLAFRDRIGERFFIHPHSVDSLCDKAYSFHSLWEKRLVESVTRITEKGLTIYGTQGPQLTRNFPWRSLAVGPGNDSLYPFRPHRFAFLPRIALATYQQIIPSEQLLDIVDSWIDEAKKGQNPFCYGSNLVVIQRMLATVWAWLFLAARPPISSPEGLGLESRLLRILWSDARYLVPRLGTSAPNNHLLADRFAAYFLQAVLPEFISHFDIEAEINFRNELLRQTYEDGGSFEHSTHYHEFACEMGAAYLLICRRQGRQPDIQIRKRVEALLRFQASLTGPEAKPLALGNATEDTLFPLDDDAGWCSGSLRELYRNLFDINLTPAPEDNFTVERAFWLLGGKFRKPAKDTEPNSIPQSFPKGGIHVYPDHELGGRLTFRSGPLLGTPITGGHMHADFLSVYLSLNGFNILEDAGTYTYRSFSKWRSSDIPAWRSYLVGPAAHNTFNIEGHDPLGEISGDFRPFDLTPRVQCRYSNGSQLAWSEGKLLHAKLYTGYTRGCIHVKSHYWIIYDCPPLTEIEGRLSWYGFQFAPGLQLSTDNFTTLVKMPNGKTCLSLVTSLPELPLVLEGSTNPLGGWVSPHYGSILPAPQLRYAFNRQEPLHYPSAFVFATQSRGCSEPVGVQCQIDGSLIILRINSNTSEDLLLIQSESMDKLSVFEGLIFEGRLLWMRIEKGQPVMLRWLDGRRVEWQKHNLYLKFAEKSGNMVLHNPVNKHDSETKA